MKVLACAVPDQRSKGLVGSQASRQIARLLGACSITLAGLLATPSWSRPPVLGAQEKTQSGVAVLIDMSASFAPLKAQDSVALETLAAELVGMAEHEIVVRQPALLFWSAIGSGFDVPPPCGPPKVFRVTLGPPRRPGELTKKKDLKAWLEACVLKLTAMRTAYRFTDISSALYRISELMRDVRGPKIVVVLSDFREDLPPGRSPVSFKLKEESVVMLYRPDPRDDNDPNRILERLSHWEKRFRDAGAKTVCRKPIAQVHPRTLRECLGG